MANQDHKSIAEGMNTERANAVLQLRKAEMSISGAADMLVNGVEDWFAAANKYYRYSGTNAAVLDKLLEQVSRFEKVCKEKKILSEAITNRLKKMKQQIADRKKLLKE